MENRVYLQPAFVLHKLEFQNTSLLIDFFCLDYGRVRAVARGARRAKSKYRGLLQVFNPLQVSFTGKGEVKTVVAVENNDPAIDLTGERLFSGLYLNELITRIMMGNIPHPSLFSIYHDTLLELRDGADINIALRRFELAFLAELGYGIDFEQDCVSHQAITAEENYLFLPDQGFERVSSSVHLDARSNNVFTGKQVLDLQRLCFNDMESKKAAKRILRLALQIHLGNKPLHSRKLFANRS